jgi:hypothetical protein
VTVLDNALQYPWASIATILPRHNRTLDGLPIGC